MERALGWFRSWRYPREAVGDEVYLNVDEELLVKTIARLHDERTAIRVELDEIMRLLSELAIRLGDS